MDIVKTQKFALVTGSRRGIGRAIGLSLLKEGFFVIFNGISPNLSQDLIQEIAKISDKVRTGVEIMKKVGKDGFTVADAEAALGEIGETPKTIVDKMSANLESGQKFMSPEQKRKMNEWLATLPSE